MGALGWLQDLVERVDVRFSGGDHDISIRALAVEDSAVFGDSHRDLTLRIGAAGNVVDRVEQ